MDNSGEFQRLVASQLLRLDEFERFALAGGLALVAQGVTDRETADIDLFGEPTGDVSIALGALMRLANREAWTVEITTETSTFVRAVVSDGRSETVLDIALDTPAPDLTVDTRYGRTLSIEDLAGRKLMALFDRAAARDFADVYRLRTHLSKQTMLDFCMRIDGGFSATVLAEMFDTIARFRDADIPLPESEIDDCRRWFRKWAAELRL